MAAVRRRLWPRAADGAPPAQNPADPVAGFSAIARNMTGMAVHLQRAGYRTAAVGKWDAGMATAQHTPHGRGYDQSLIYYHHANDYWQYTTGSCAEDSTPAPKGHSEKQRRELNFPPLPPPPHPAGCSSKYTIKPNAGVCGDPTRQLFVGKVAGEGECCAKCSSLEGCVGWTLHAPTETGNSAVCFTCNGTRGVAAQGRISGCVGAEACAAGAITDLWSNEAPARDKKPPPTCVAQVRPPLRTPLTKALTIPPC